MPANHLLTRLYSACAETSALEGVALRATVVLPILVLQQPHRRSKLKELTACLERRLKAWKDGDVPLVEEGGAIQHIANYQAKSNGIQPQACT